MQNSSRAAQVGSVRHSVIKIQLKIHGQILCAGFGTCLPSAGRCCRNFHVLTKQILAPNMNESSFIQHARKRVIKTSTKISRKLLCITNIVVYNFVMPL